MDRDDICLWPNGDWCWRHQLDAYLRDHSDDFEVLAFDSERWHALLLEEGC